MGAGLAAGIGSSSLWYLTRGAGLMALILLTSSVALGVMNVSGWHTSRWPRFATAQLHRNVSLLAVAFLALHITTAELDTFAPVGWLAVAFPFASAYRPVWLGLGTLAFDLLLAVTLTSLFRVQLGLRVWRAVHWTAYAAWPLALVHGLGTGTDARLGWAQLMDVTCLAVVLAAVAWRLITDRPGRAKLHVTAGIGFAAILVGVVAWAYTGPLEPGWARRSGTPTNLLATSRAPTPPGPRSSLRPGCQQ